jgi:von Willebrand factor type A domain
MRSGWLAFLIALALHGGIVAALCLLPGGRMHRIPGLLFQDAGNGPEVITLLVSEQRQDVVDIAVAPSPPPSRAQTRPAQIPESKPALPKTSATQPKRVQASGHSAAKTQPGGNGDSGEPTTGVTTTFFQVPAQGQKILYVIDASASMGPTGALEVASREVLASVRRLPDSAHFQVLVYNRTASPLLPRWPGWLMPTADKLAALEEAVKSLQAEGGTDHAGALREALCMDPDVLFFLTDAAGDIPAGVPPEVSRRNQRHAVIHVIELNSGQPTGNDGALRALAAENRGVLRVVPLH